MPATVNEELRARAILHAHLIERLKASEVRRILSMLNSELYPELLAEIEKRLARIAARGHDVTLSSTARLRELRDAVDDVIAEGMGQAYSAAKAGLLDAAPVEAQAQAAILDRSVPFEFEFKLPSTATLRSAALSRPFQGKLLKDWYGELEASTQARVRETLTQGLVRGEDVDTIVRGLRGTRANGYADGVLEGSRREVAAVVRAAVQHVSAHARESTYDANRDLIKGVQWVSTLDARTTAICMSLDGKVYGVDEGPRPPAHFGCRSTTVPVMKSLSEVLGIPGIKDVEPGSRSSMNGQVAGTQTYGEWLRDQPVEVQNEALGVGRARLFRRGEIDVRGLVDANLRPLTLDEIRRKLGLAA